MRKVFIASVIALSVLSLTGCVNAGNQSLKKETEESVKTKITQGTSTKSDVKKAFGSPAETTFTDGGKEIWKYEFTDISSDAVNYIPVVNLFGSSSSGVKKELVVMFDGDTVDKYSMSESDHAVKSGMFR
ncbi:hypothetical protein [Morganella sp. EGD-HP17]|uniref:hypothetical protein n=1 Tax=Morganella sp. EGD-HP17 TaxID=1435146 RepID=UPI00040CC1D0|nr:hypothetical protein [Morganella sp. EGD-HP17]ETO41270.1 hypothetical protein X965_10955 [Morganella sp. EGD-HP17]